ncbi:cytochrome P450 [Streptomyces sp. NPDC101206]|uniref:cytochrome P450 n=1 Tax=Streptomyces sp. NPDC101206 TaxID=3366128 RepID=UPI0038146AF9
MKNGTLQNATWIVDPYPTLARLRAQAPVHRLQQADGTALWFVTREPDVRTALMDRRLTVDPVHSRSDRGHSGFSLPGPLRENLLTLDGKAHARLRRFAAPAFSARRAETWRERIRSTTARLAAGLATRPSADLIADFAIPLPLTVAADLLGVPAAHRPALAEWTTAMVTHDRHQQLDAAVHHVHGLIARLIHARRRQPGPDLLSTWVTARDTHQHISDDELVSLAFQIWWAGIENVTHAIGHGILLLLDHPHQADALRAEPGRMAATVEELLRRTAPTATAAPRFARHDLTLAGARIRAGDTVVLSLASANRDPAPHTLPDRFTPGRLPSRHLAFGHGPHYCPGTALARIQLQTALEYLLHLPGPALTPDRPPRCRNSMRLHGFDELPVTIASHLRPSPPSSGFHSFDGMRQANSPEPEL